MKLLNSTYRKIGFYLLALSLPISIVIILILRYSLSSYEAIWDSWGLNIIYYPISASLILISFSETEEENARIKALRVESFFWGAFAFTSMCILFPMMLFLIEKVLSIDLKILFPSNILSSLNLLLISVNYHFYLGLRDSKKKYFIF